MSILDNALDEGEIDFLCDSLRSKTSIKQPGHGTSMIAAIGKWTCDARLLKNTNKVLQRFDLPSMCILDKKRMLMVVVFFSQSFITSDSAHDKFKGMLNATNGKINTTCLDGDCVFGHDMPKCCE